MNINFEKISEILVSYYMKEFAGKPNGRYKFSYDQLLRITQRKYLNHQCLQNIFDECRNHGFVVIELNNKQFVLMDLTPMYKYRKLSSKIVEETLTEKEEQLETEYSFSPDLNELVSNIGVRKL